MPYLFLISSILSKQTSVTGSLMLKASNIRQNLFSALTFSATDRIDSKSISILLSNVNQINVFMFSCYGPGINGDPNPSLHPKLVGVLGLSLTLVESLLGLLWLLGLSLTLVESLLGELGELRLKLLESVLGLLGLLMVLGELGLLGLSLTLVESLLGELGELGLLGELGEL